MANKYFKQLHASVAEILDKHGFQKRGKHMFARLCDDLIYIVLLNQGRKSANMQDKITVDIGIFSVWLANIAGRQALESSAYLPGMLISDCHWSERIGYLMPNNDDVWWDIDTLENAVASCSQITHAIQEYCLPQFNRFTSVSDLIESWKRGISPGLSKLQRETLLSIALNSSS